MRFHSAYTLLVVLLGVLPNLPWQIEASESPAERTVLVHGSFVRPGQVLTHTVNLYSDGSIVYRNGPNQYESDLDAETLLEVEAYVRAVEPGEFAVTDRPCHEIPYRDEVMVKGPGIDYIPIAKADMCHDYEFISSPEAIESSRFLRQLVMDVVEGARLLFDSQSRMGY